MRYKSREKATDANSGESENIDAHDAPTSGSVGKPRSQRGELKICVQK
jgi:hypothetical protein